jgi:CRP-like cAMP-binding protein
MQPDISILESLEIFEELSADELAELSALIHTMRVREGEVLTRRGDTAHTFYIVLSGNYMIYFKGGRAFTLHHRGDLIGVATILTPFRYRGTTVALTDGEVLAMAGDKFMELIQSNASLGDKLLLRLNEVIHQRSSYVDEAKEAETP